jgi:hypothetical protein
LRNRLGSVRPKELGLRNQEITAIAVAYAQNPASFEVVKGISCGQSLVGGHIDDVMHYHPASFISVRLCRIAWWKSPTPRRFGDVQHSTGESH